MPTIAPVERPARELRCASIMHPIAPPSVHNAPSLSQFVLSAARSTPKPAPLARACWQRRDDVTVTVSKSPSTTPGPEKSGICADELRRDCTWSGGTTRPDCAGAVSTRSRSRSHRSRSHSESVARHWLQLLLLFSSNEESSTELRTAAPSHRFRLADGTAATVGQRPIM